MAKLTNYNIRVCLVVTIASFSFGFGASVFVTSVGQPGFYNYFDLDPNSLRTSRSARKSSSIPSQSADPTNNRCCQYSQRNQCSLFLWLRSRLNWSMFRIRLGWTQESPGHCCSAFPHRQRPSRRFGGHPYADCDAHHSRSRVGHAACSCATVPHRGRSTAAPRVPNGLDPVFDWYWLYYVCRLIPQDHC
jgi:hypothetical protein